MASVNLIFAQTEITSRSSDVSQITNLLQLQAATLSRPGAVMSFNLAGTVLGGNPDRGIIVLQDETGTELLETTRRDQTFKPGQRIRLRGNTFVVATSLGVSLGQTPVIENDGLHSESEISSSIYLKQGLHPIQVEWFNYTSYGLLGLDYSGPGFGRMTVPDAVLFQAAAVGANGQAKPEPGLIYRCYEGDWHSIPNFETMVPIKSGVSMNLDLRAETRAEYVGLDYNGFIQIDTNGLYTFYLRSDDGSRLYIDKLPIQFDVLGEGRARRAISLDFRRQTSAAAGPFWSEAEGTITFIGETVDGIELELTTDQSRLRVIICDASSQLPRYLMGSRIRVRGVCLDTHDIQMHRSFNTVIVPDCSDVQVQDVPDSSWSSAKSFSTVTECRHSVNPNASESVVLRGQIRTDGKAQAIFLEDKTGSVPVEILNPTLPQANEEVECLGSWVGAAASDKLRWGFWRSVTNGSSGTLAKGILLTSAAQVQQLTRAEARLGYPAKIRGVVTWVSSKKNGVVIQDSIQNVYAARGVSVGLTPPWNSNPPMVGEIFEVEGTTIAGDFSPILILSNAMRIGMGELPDPKHPTYDELLNGSMDSQCVEIQGYVSGAWDRHLMLLMPGGRVDVEFDPNPADDLKSLIHSVVRIRGCMFAKWDASTLLVTTDHPLWFGNAVICVEVPAPANPFDAPQMHARELMQFDARANFFQRVKVFGQVLADDQGIYYCADDGFGFRFKPEQSVKIEPGNIVEVAGLVELGRSSPLIREAYTRKTGQAPLPEPHPYVFGGTNTLRDSTRISVQGLLIEVKNIGAEEVLQMQSGMRTFEARLRLVQPVKSQWKIGGTLKLTGVFSGSEGAENSERGNPVELIVNSPGDVIVLAQPPWWTLDRLLAIAGVMSAGLALAFLWIKLLRRQVKLKTAELKHEVNERQKIEQARAIELERARIAQDLHDDLGSRTTAISMLAVAGIGHDFEVAASKERFGMILERSRSLVAALDELVWAANPKYDTIGALVEYLAGIAEELLTETGIARRMELPANIPEGRIPAEIRHNVLLAAKEALNNAIRHGHPTEVLLELKLVGGQLEILIRDNGCGFDPDRQVAGNGLVNIQQRIKKIGGQYRIESEPDKGTSVHLIFPLL
jgi:signal transduction histidine kinase